MPKGDISITDLASSLPFIHYLPNSRIGAQSDTIARRLNIVLNTRYELDNTQTLVRFVQANYGWAIVSALCLAPHRTYLEGVRLINLSDGAHARSVMQLNRKNELGELPEKIAHMSRTLFSKKMVPELQKLAPWLAEQAFATDQLQII